MDYRKIFIFVFLVSFMAISLSQVGLGDGEKQALKKEIVKLKYTKASEVYDLLIPFRSKKGHILYSKKLNMITISDYPKNVERMLEVIKQCDVKPKQIEFKIWLIVAEIREKPKSVKIPAIAKVVKELESFLKYNYYQLLDSSYLKTSEGSYSYLKLGGTFSFGLEFGNLKFIRDKEGTINFTVRLKKSKTIEGKVYTDYLITSNLTLKNGETTVVGVSKMNGDNKGLILIITAKALD